MSFFGEYIISCNSMFKFNRAVRVGEYRKTHYTHQKNAKKNLGHRGKKLSYDLIQYCSKVI